MSVPNTMRHCLIGAAVFVLLPGCQTPPAVYDLAEKTSANAGAFQVRLGELDARSKALAGKRADLIVSMESFNAELDGFVKRELYMRQQSNKPADWAKIDALMKKLAALRDELIKIEQDARIAEQQRRQEILARRTDLNTNAAAMRDATNALNALARRESVEDRAKFIGRFVKDVKDEVDAGLAKDDKTSRDANALADKIKGSLKSAAGTDSGEGNK